MNDKFDKFTERARKVLSLAQEEAQRFKSTFPVEHPWWFRQITPTGWSPVKGGVQWQY